MTQLLGMPKQVCIISYFEIKNEKIIERIDICALLLFYTARPIPFNILAWLPHASYACEETLRTKRTFYAHRIKARKPCLQQLLHLGV